MPTGWEIGPARGPRDIAQIEELFRDYADGLGIDLSFQGFERELVGLPGRYAPPRGDLLLARGGADEALGCVGLRPLDRAGACEIKRFYVRPAARGIGVGRTLATAVVGLATRLGYREAVLDTLPSMHSAIAIYRAIGFEPIPAYSNATVPGLLYFGKRLKPPDEADDVCR